jgi:folylpolyglutamate synthase/dihydropteroate synthase
MSYSGTINYLYNLQKHGIKFGLENISRLMSLFDNPHESFLSVHVAGTNGKGSVSAIIASVLRTSGLKVGLFTSPHIVSFTERIRINDEEITEDDVIGLTEEIRGVVERRDDFSPTFFEVVTAMALLYFKRKKVDIAVIEVGMGGRLDATNIITPEVSVITNISYDHREFLGAALKEIACEKAGIIKDGVPVVVSYQEPEAMEVIERKTVEKGARLYVYGRDFSSVLRREDLSGICFDYRSSDSFAIRDLVLPLTGEHQMQNASVAIKTIELLSKKLTSHFLFLTSCNELSLYLSPSPTPPVEGGGIAGVSPIEGGERVVMPPVEGEESVAVFSIDGGEHTPAPLSRGDLPSPPLGRTGEGSPRRVEKFTQRGKGKGGKKPLDPIWYHFIRKGLENVKWPGRLEIVKKDPLILIDGAHNPAAAEALSRAFKKLFLGKYGRIIIVLGIMGDKDVRGIMEPLLPFASEIILTSPEYSRAASPEKLASTAASLGFFNVRIAPTVRDAIKMATDLAHDAPGPSVIVITGSFYTIGEAKEAMGIKSIFARLREC